MVRNLSFKKNANENSEDMNNENFQSNDFNSQKIVNGQQGPSINQLQVEINQEFEEQYARVK